MSKEVVGNSMVSMLMIASLTCMVDATVIINPIIAVCAGLVGASGFFISFMCLGFFKDDK